jgi:hypothetical protein
MEILVVDLETAAHDPNKSDLRDLNNSLIIEISIVLANLETGKIEPVLITSAGRTGRAAMRHGFSRTAR